MHVEPWKTIEAQPLPFNEFSWSAETDSAATCADCQGALLLRSPAVQHRYGPLPRRWYTALIERTGQETFPLLLTAATATGVSRGTSDLFSCFQMGPPMAVTAGRYVNAFQVARKYDEGASLSHVAAGAVCVAKQEYGESNASSDVASVLSSSENMIESAGAQLYQTLTEPVVATIATADREGEPSELPERRH